MDKLSFTLESYLDAVYELSDGDNGARLTDVAKRMKVAKSTASAAMSSLTERNLVFSEHYGHIRLTDKGLEIAKLIMQKHGIVYNFFTEVLGLDSSAADADACAIEHVISTNAVLAMQKKLKQS